MSKISFFYIFFFLEINKVIINNLLRCIRCAIAHSKESFILGISTFFSRQFLITTSYITYIRQNIVEQTTACALAANQYARRSLSYDTWNIGLRDYMQRGTRTRNAERG